MAEPISRNDHVVRSWHEWEIDGLERRVILVVETDVEFRPEDPDYSAARFEEVRTAAIEELRSSPSPIDRIRIVPVRY